MSNNNSNCKKCKELICGCKKNTISSIDILPVTPSCEIPEYCKDGCVETISSNCITISPYPFEFIKDKNGNPITTVNNTTDLQNLLIGLDKLLVDLTSKINDCCGILQVFNTSCILGDKYILTLFRRNSVTISTNKEFNTLLDLVTYLQSYDNFYLDGTSIKVKSIFTWTLEINCSLSTCPLIITIIPSNDPEDPC